MGEGTQGSLRFNSTRDIHGYMLHSLAGYDGTSWAAGVMSPEISSDQEEELYRAIGVSPAMREWVGGRMAKKARTDGFRIKNIKWESTVEIEADWLRREKTGQIAGFIDGLAKRRAQLWGKLTSERVAAGAAATSLCFDGQPFYSASHQSGESGVQSNIATADISTYPVADHGAAATAPSFPEMAHAVLDGIVKFLTFVDDQGEPANEDEGSFLIHVPVGLAKVAKGALGQVKSDRGTDNPLLDAGYSLRVYADPRLTIAGWTDKFAIHSVGASTYPFLRQVEAGTSEEMVLGEDSDFYKQNDAYQFGVKVNGNVDYADWKNSVQVQLV